MDLYREYDKYLEIKQDTTPFYLRYSYYREGKFTTTILYFSENHQKMSKKDFIKRLVDNEVYTEDPMDVTFWGLNKQ